MGAPIQVQNRTDSNALRMIHTHVQRLHTRQAFAVCAHAVAQVLRESRQATLVFPHGEQKGQGAQDSSRKDHSICLDFPAPGQTKGPPRTGFHGDSTPFLGLMHSGHSGVCIHPYAELFRHVQVVEGQGVFGPVAAANHTGSATDATRALRSFPIKVGVRHRDSLFPKPNRHAGRVVLVFEV